MGMGQGVVTKGGSGVGFFLAIMYIVPEFWKHVTDCKYLLSNSPAPPELGLVDFKMKADLNECNLKGPTKT